MEKELAEITENENGAIAELAIPLQPAARERDSSWEEKVYAEQESKF